MVARKKYDIVQRLIENLNNLKYREHHLATDHAAQETLRLEILTLLGHARYENNLTCSNVISSGKLGSILHHAISLARDYEFPEFDINQQDQFIFSQTSEKHDWHSYFHIDSTEQLFDSLDEIYRCYHLEPGSLKDIQTIHSPHASRFGRLTSFSSGLAHATPDLFSHYPTESFNEQKNGNYIEQHLDHFYRFKQLDPSTSYPSQADLYKVVHTSHFYSFYELAKMNNLLFAKRLWTGIKDIFLIQLYDWLSHLWSRTKKSAYGSAKIKYDEPRLLTQNKKNIYDFNSNN